MNTNDKHAENIPEVVSVVLNESITNVSEPKSDNNVLVIAGAIIIAGALIAAAIFFSDNNNGGSVPVAPVIDVAKVKTAGRPFIGDLKAPATMAYWFDYQCPFCKRFETEIMSQLVNDYVKTGKLKIVYKDFQFLGEDSNTAGFAAHAVWEVAPDKFYDWHEAVLGRQDGENSGWGSKDDILALTKTISGIDADRVAQLMVSKQAEYQRMMDDDKMEGGKLGINGTPASIIGKQLISGLYPNMYPKIKQLVDIALQEK